ncbi:hypothetical protein LSAT2_024164 [Lamellibrachia satsuma]|nr:hypothetical protein LSAT2_024164 [Lamellibrachia satsuma]
MKSIRNISNKGIISLVCGLVCIYLLWNWHYGNSHGASMNVFYDTVHSDKSDYRHYETVQGNRHDAWKSIFDDTLHPDKSDCRQLLAQPVADEDFYTASYIEHRRNMEPKVLAANGGRRRMEGHSGQVKNQFRLYYWLARLSWVNTICEIGFNAGHSALQFLAASEKVTVYSFDIGQHNYTRPMANYLGDTFHGRLHLTIGNSLKAVPRFAETHHDVKCDVVIVDGGHTYNVAVDDLRNMGALANKDHHVLVFDDYPTLFKEGKYMTDLGKAWNTMRADGLVIERYACTEHPKKGRGFVVGYYL